MKKLREMLREMLRVRGGRGKKIREAGRVREMKSPGAKGEGNEKRARVGEVSKS